MEKKTKRSFRVFSLCLTVMLCLILALPAPVSAASASIKLNATKKTLTVGGSVKLKATVTGKSKTVTWKSSDSSVAAVGKTGKVTAKKAGKATITAKANGKTAKCVVTVKKAATVDFSIGIGSVDRTRNELLSRIRKVSGLKAGKNSKYPDLYYTGAKVTVGLNCNAEAGTSKDVYLYVKNTGNKQVTFLDIQIGDTREQVLTKIQKHGGRAFRDGSGYYVGNATRITTVFTNGKLTQYLAQTMPSG